MHKTFTRANNYDDMDILYMRISKWYICVHTYIVCLLLMMKNLQISARMAKYITAISNDT
jgi:hypothetical protein